MENDVHQFILFHDLSAVFMSLNIVYNLIFILLTRFPIVTDRVQKQVRVPHIGGCRWRG